MRGEKKVGGNNKTGRVRGTRWVDEKERNGNRRGENMKTVGAKNGWREKKGALKESRGGKRRKKDE